MQILMLISFCFSMFMSVEASFMDGVRSNFAYEDVTHVQSCIDTLNLFLNSFNNKQKSLVLSCIAPEQKELRDAIIYMIQTRNIEYLFNLYSVADGGVEILSDRIIKFKGYYQLKEAHAYSTLTSHGIFNYFILEKRDEDVWLIVDTNFHTRLDWDYFYAFILFLFFPFYIWMLIDCFNRKFEKRGKWFCIICFIPFIGLLLYFFCVKLKQWDNQPDYYEKYLQNDFYSKDAALTIRNNWIYSWTLSLLGMIVCIWIPHALCNGMMLEIVTSIRMMLLSLSFIYIFSWISAYLNLGTGVISISLLIQLIMILWRVWEYGMHVLDSFSGPRSLVYQDIMKDALVFVVIIVWLLWLFLVSYRLLKLNEAVQDRKDIQA